VISNIICLDVFPFLAIVSSVTSRARSGTRPVPPRRMQRSSSKLGQLCHSASSLGSPRRRTITSLLSDSLRSNVAGSSKTEELVESMREFLEDGTRTRAKDERMAMRKGGTGVLDRAANWAHATPMRKRRVPPQGIPQQSVKKILRVSQDMFDDEVFNTELGDKMLPKGSFLEVRRSVRVKSFFRSFAHGSECAGTMQ